MDFRPGIRLEVGCGRHSSMETPSSTDAASKVNRSPLRILAAVIILAAGLVIIVFITQQADIANRDFISYWASGRQLLRHHDPYDQQAILSLQRSAGFQGDRAFLMRNGPNGLFLGLLLALLPSRIAAILWSLTLVAALMASIRMLWKMHGQQPDRLHFLGYVFPPVLCCLLMGQFGILMLFGFTLFLYLHRERPYLAGCGLVLCFIKPHLFGAFAVALLLWSITRKRYRVLAGAGGAILASCFLPLCLDVHVWRDYARGIGAERIESEFIPTLSYVFRSLLHREWFWLQFVPLFLSLGWAFWYFRKHRDTWSWLQDGSLLVAVGVLAAPYAWFSDECIALPAVLGGIYALERANRALWLYGVFAAIGLMEVLFLVPVKSGYYLWTAPAWVAWSVYANRPVRAHRDVPAVARSA